MIFNTTAAQIIDKSLDINTHKMLLRQLFYASFGTLLGSFIYQIGYERIIQKSSFALGLGTFLLVILFIPGIGQTVNGATRWIGIGGFTFQPSECIKVFLPAVFIHWASKQSTIAFRPFCKMVSILLIPVVLIFFQPDNGTIVIILSTFLVLFWLSKVKWHYWALPTCIVFMVGAAAAYQMPHVRSRIHVYLHPELDLKGKGHQPHQSKIAAGSGGLIGRGLGESLQKLNYLPEARNDYIAAIFAEEMGFVGILGMIALYMIFAFAGFFVSVRARDFEGFLFAASLTFLIAIQAFLNLGVVSGLLPSKGMTLPFFSQGGTSLIVNIAALFLLLDIARKAKLEVVEL